MVRATLSVQLCLSDDNDPLYPALRRRRSGDGLRRGAAAAVELLARVRGACTAPLLLLLFSAENQGGHLVR